MVRPVKFYKNLPLWEGEIEDPPAHHVLKLVLFTQGL
jgi:hypothetical protein